MNYYNILGINKNATNNEIKKSYHKLAMKYHPDKNQGLSDEKFKNITEAYEVLSNVRKRKEYDSKGFISILDLDHDNIFNDFIRSFDLIFNDHSYMLPYEESLINRNIRRMKLNSNVDGKYFSQSINRTTVNGKTHVKVITINDGEEIIQEYIEE